MFQLLFLEITYSFVHVTDALHLVASYLEGDVNHCDILLLLLRRNGASEIVKSVQ